MRTEDLRKGPWYEQEDERLKTFVAVLGPRRWDTVATISGLRRSGKSCRLRWLNYLRPCLKHGAITQQEEQRIFQLHERWGNKWAKIARRLPGRTDNEVKNYWRTRLRKNVQVQNDSLLHPSTSSPTTCNVSAVETSPSSDHTNNYFNDLDVSTQVSNTITLETRSSDNENQLSTDVNIEVKSKHCNNDDIHMGLLDCIDINTPYESRISDCMIVKSPYENRVSDWINMMPKDQIDKLTGYWEISNYSSEFSLDYYQMPWCFGGGNAWDFQDTKWDMDLFNVNEQNLK